ncbi:hypothetical protein WJX73_003815 [Symbiochloris irregularis]|uniref:AB hydrolase-1 domain-containing protein n=1 Tax=Symbiochloris irregularis TaxID=706552 RepID=A0AAW1Q020_9CHLO
MMPEEEASWTSTSQALFLLSAVGLFLFSWLLFRKTGSCSATGPHASGWLRHTTVALGQGLDSLGCFLRDRFPALWRGLHRLSALAATYSDAVINKIYSPALLLENAEQSRQESLEASRHRPSWIHPKAWTGLVWRWSVWCWRLFHTNDRPMLYCKPGGVVDSLKKDCPALHLTYSPPIWARNRHVHLISSVLLRKPFISPKYKRELLKLKDGGTVGLDWFYGCNESGADRFKDNSPVVLVVHALTGDSNDSYVKWMCNAAYQQNWRAVSFNYRGVGGVPLTSPRPFHQPTDTADVAQAIQHVRSKYPGAPIFAVGFSLGAYTLNKFMGEVDSGVFPAEAKVSGCACLGSGYDFNAEMVRVSKPHTMSMQYCQAINYYWKAYIKEHAAMLAKAPGVDWEKAKQAPTVQDFDRAAIVPIFGYKNLDECYNASNGLVWIPKIQTPTMLVSAQDDPFLDKKVMPTQQCQGSSHVLFVLTKFGSHCGHMQGWWPLGQSWLDVVVMDFFNAVLKGESHSSDSSTKGDNVGMRQLARSKADWGALSQLTERDTFTSSAGQADTDWLLGPCLLPSGSHGLQVLPSDSSIPTKSRHDKSSAQSDDTAP